MRDKIWSTSAGCRGFCQGYLADVSDEEEADVHGPGHDLGALSESSDGRHLHSKNHKGETTDGCGALGHGSC